VELPEEVVPWAELSGRVEPEVEVVEQVGPGCCRVEVIYPEEVIGEEPAQARTARLLSGMGSQPVHLGTEANHQALGEDGESVARPTRQGAGLAHERAPAQRGHGLMSPG
jgi:hypothetical protein